MQEYSSGTYKINTIPMDSFSRTSWKANSSTGYRSLASFLKHINNFGVQVQNNFEVEFTGLEGITFFVQSFDLPGSKQNTCEIFYNGIKMTLPVNYECEHEFSMTVVNDAQGFIYSAIKSYIEYDSYNHYSSSQQKLIIRALTGQVYNYNTGLVGDNNFDIAYQGTVIVAYGVRFNSMSGLTYGQNSNDMQTFTVQGTLIEYSHLPKDLSWNSRYHNM